MVIKYVNDYLVNLILRTHEIFFGGKTRMSYFMFLYRDFFFCKYFREIMSLRKV